MDYKEKLYALIGIVGKARVAEYLGMSAPTFASRLKNSGDWKLHELDTINKVYNQLFPEQAK